MYLGDYHQSDKERYSLVGLFSESVERRELNYKVVFLNSSSSLFFYTYYLNIVSFVVSCFAGPLRWQ